MHRKSKVVKLNNKGNTLNDKIKLIHFNSNKAALMIL